MASVIDRFHYTEKLSESMTYKQEMEQEVIIANTQNKKHISEVVHKGKNNLVLF